VGLMLYSGHISCVLVVLEVLVVEQWLMLYSGTFPVCWGCSGPQIWVLVKNGQKVTFWVKRSKIDFWPHGFGGLVDVAVG